MREIVDLRESIDGDLLLHGEDLADTGTNYAIAIHQIIKTILNTNIGESFLYPNMGFNTDDFVGTNNNERTARLLSIAIKEAIANNSIFYITEIDVDVFPLSINTIACNIKLNTVKDNELGYLLVYDSSVNMIKSLVLDGSPNNLPGTIVKKVSPTVNSRAKQKF